MKWKEIIHRNEIDALAQDLSTPILFFKHSARCPICVLALQRIETAWHIDDYTRLKPCIIHVRQARAASDYLAEKYGTPHASPQVLLIRDNQVIHHASHESIHYEDIQQALQKTT